MSPHGAIHPTNGASLLLSRPSVVSLTTSVETSVYMRSYIRAGDTTTAGGEVRPRPRRHGAHHHGALAGHEGDPVWCPACQSHGSAKCVPPFRSDTGPDGRQKILDGDLCVCRCATPPRLVARFHHLQAAFTAAEIARTQGAAAGWLEYAGHTARFQSEPLAGGG